MTFMLDRVSFLGPDYWYKQCAGITAIWNQWCITCCELRHRPAIFYF